MEWPLVVSARRVVLGVDRNRHVELSLPFDRAGGECCQSCRSTSRVLDDGLEVMGNLEATPRTFSGN
jgi:hypothetical protein